MDQPVQSLPSLTKVIPQISRFDEFLRDSYVDLEPRHLVRHLFLLCDASSRKGPVSVENNWLGIPLH